ncbi:glycosyltransferase [Candidatus Uhrbacteria bacterium]|nr:glycosyltransferase [Candidatus Uhrbacteria bacterium]
MPRLSVIIPTLNEERYLPKLLDSLGRQTFRDFEIIVADARSLDRTRALALDRGARVVPGGSPSIGRNAGARAATGEVLLFLDADVVLPDTDFLRRTLVEFDRRKLDVATALVTPLGERMIDRILHEFYNVYTVAVQKIFPHMPGFFIFVRRRVHEKIGGFDETLDFAEDHEYARRASKKGAFGFLRSARIHVSTRRLDRDGRLTIALKYLLGELYLMTRGRVPPGAMDYTFGYDKAVRRESPIKILWKNGRSLWGKPPKFPPEA